MRGWLRICLEEEDVLMYILYICMYLRGSKQGFNWIVHLPGMAQVSSRFGATVVTNGYELCFGVIAL